MKHTDLYKELPELLAPAGSPDALNAAIEGGADAVYFGGSLFSNRMRAKNFDEAELFRSVAMCKAYSVKSYITVNTRLRDVELCEALDFVRSLYCAGADAFIIADAGLAAAVKEAVPSAELHASTQMTGVNAADAAALASLGFSRMVCPRELSRNELKLLIDSSPIDIEMFIHGAHCVSVSGQCLMSWAMGGRSGNRGECAQPCRLPYRMAGCRNVSAHPLSLKDMCLAEHVPEIISMNVRSLKIEGRLKSPDYVYGVVGVWRRLLDERRSATPDEIAYLDGIFSRDGFTDGYYRNKYTSMNGMRREGTVPVGEKFEGLSKKIPISAHARLILGEPFSLTLSCAGTNVSAEGDTVQEAKSAPLTDDMLYKNISKLGGMPYSLARNDFTCESDGKGFLSVAQINAIRRSAVSFLERAVAKSAKRELPDITADNTAKADAVSMAKPVKTAFFQSPAAVPDVAYDAFDIIFLPHRFGKVKKVRRRAEMGISLPLWQTDRDTDEVKASLEAFKAEGGTYVLAHSYSQITLSRDAGLVPIASERLNITNRRAAEVMMDLGARYVILSPELKAPAIRDISKKSRVACGCAVYGRLPLMLLRRCVMSDSGCSGKCMGQGCLLPREISDRKGVRLSVIPIGGRMNLILNPNPLWCADKNETGDVGISHFMFTTEDAQEASRIIEAYRLGLSHTEAGISQIKRI
ncbi:MAG: U32 family peptidase [Clostridia bacterium]|nr:U32 family peptidase [Clostridia bacterium]